jgi:hypothetical protein
VSRTAKEKRNGSMKLIIKLFERTTKKRQKNLLKCFWYCIENDDDDDESDILDCISGL